jgi:hypothetical protein
MNMKRLLSFSTFLLLSFLVDAQSPTFSEHIAPIIYNHCTKCHRDGEIGPFPLSNYSQVSARGEMIKHVTSINYMPPWQPDPGYKRYQRENYLSDAQKQQIVAWVDAGMPQGNPSFEPPLPVFPTGSQVGVPDLTVSFAKKHVHPGNNIDEYRYFAIPTGLTQDKKIKSIEFRPGNTKLVHHTLIWEDTTGQTAAFDAATPEYGYGENQGTGANLNQPQLPGYVPGCAPPIYSNGIFQTLHAGSDLKLQVHYAPSSVDETDSSSINIFFENGQSDRPLQSTIMLPFGNVLVNGPFIIPANTTREFHGRISIPYDISLYSISPHCHKLGTHWKVYAVKPSGDTLPLINIKKWDFNWQGDYQFRQLIKVPAGSVIHAFAGYDNTTNNVNNPHSPPQSITWGQGTAEEMFYLPITYLQYQAGDENIVFETDSIVTGNAIKLRGMADKLYPVFPVPSQDELTIGYTLANSGKVSINLISIDGKKVEAIENESYHLPGYHTRRVPVSKLSPGIYFLEMIKGQDRQTQKVVIGK